MLKVWQVLEYGAVVATLAQIFGAEMDIAGFGALLGGLGQVAGGAAGLFRQNQSPVNNSTMMQNWRNDDMAFAREQFQFQKELASNGIRWRVEDAKAAGLHPLAALGASSGSYSPISVVSAPPQEGSGYSGGGIGESLANMGQGLGRAISATQTQKEKAVSALDLVRLEGANLDNEYKKLLIASEAKKLNQAGTGPGLPDGAINASMGRGIYEAKRPEVPNARSDSPSTVAGPPQPQAIYNRTPTGGIYTTPHKDMNMDELESPGRLSWSLHNGLLPYVSQYYRDAARPPKSELPPGAVAWRLGAPGMGWLPVYPEFPSQSSGHMGYVKGQNSQNWMNYRR